MDAELTFLGAAKNVTGSCTVVRLGNRRVLVDCGMFQERQMQDHNYKPFPVDPSTLDAVLLTHAHLDHCGRVPKLVKEGFKGRILGTPATLDIVKVILFDSAFIQEEDIRRKKKRHEKTGKVSPYPYEPMYRKEHVENTCLLFEPVAYEQTVEVAPGTRATFLEAGHIFGSAMIRLELIEGENSRSVLFSGDLGRKDLPIIRDPHPFEGADYLVVESTYGDRTHGSVASIPEEFERVIHDTQRRGGNLIIPGFAVERTQEILYHLTLLLKQKRIPPLLTFVDSPMAVAVTDIFKKHPYLLDEETVALLEEGNSPYDFPGLTLTRSVAQSKAINLIKGVAIIIAGSGMCTGGRIKHHLYNNLARRESTILFVGHQSPGTLGRHLLDGNPEARLFGETLPVHAKIERITGFSGHADAGELMDWLSSAPQAPRTVFINHGEESAAQALSDRIQEIFNWKCEIPGVGDSMMLE